LCRTATTNVVPKSGPEVTQKLSCGIHFSDLRRVFSGVGAILDDLALDGDFTVSWGGDMSVLGGPLLDTIFALRVIKSVKNVNI